MTPTPRLPRLQVLLPLEPDESLDDVHHLLSALFVPDRTHVRRVYVQRPITSDVFLTPEYADIADLARIELDAETATRVRSEREMKPLSKTGFEVSADILRGSPRAEVLNEASAWPADFVAVRARRTSGSDDGLGQMAAALLHHAPCPVLLYREISARFALRRVLVPVDFSPASRAAVPWALAIAGLRQARTDLLHVIDEGAVGGRIAAPELVRMAREELALWRGTREGERLGAEVVAAESPSDGILQFAGHHEYDLIVLPATGASQMAAVLLGSTVRRVVRGTSVPVLVLPVSNRVTLERFLERAGSVRVSDLSAARA
jgi:nucleotide-binding universal stress UspA family protein